MIECVGDISDCMCIYMGGGEDHSECGAYIMTWEKQCENEVECDTRFFSQ